MIKDNIINLNNGTSYYILEEIIYNNKKYVLAAQCDLENDKTDEDKYIVMEIIVNDVGILTLDIEDEALAKTVTAMLLDKANKE